MFHNSFAHFLGIFYINNSSELILISDKLVWKHSYKGILSKRKWNTNFYISLKIVYKNEKL